jgi:Phosphotransferase enzyme family
MWSDVRTTMPGTTVEEDFSGAIFAAFGVGPEAFLGRGGEAAVYALDDERVLRVQHPGTDTDQLARTEALLRDLMTAAVPFRSPEILEIGEIGGRTYAVERRLPGRSLLERLHEDENVARDELIEAYLEAAWALGGLRPEGWDYYGELAAPRPLRAGTWREFLTVRAERSLAAAGYPLNQIAGPDLAQDLPEPGRAEFVHLDAFPGNMLTDGVDITAVLDIGYSCVAGDRRLNPLAAVVYLELRPQSVPIGTDRDRAVAQAWLRSAGLLDLLNPARRWLAAFWAFATDDLPLQAWCRSVLLPSA